MSCFALPVTWDCSVVPAFVCYPPPVSGFAVAVPTLWSPSCWGGSRAGERQWALAYRSYQCMKVGTPSPPPPTNGQTCSALFWASGLIISLHWYHSYWLESTLLEFVDRLMKRLYAMALPEYTHHQRTGMGCRVCPNLPRPNRKPSGVRVKHSLAEMLLLFSQGRVKISKYTWHMQTMNHSNRSVRLLPA